MAPMAATKLCDSDADLYRRYAVGLLSYDDALGQAQSVFHLRRALLEFDQVARLAPSRRAGTASPGATSM